MEENICRVCRSSESTVQDPLFYPCKCSGSMKWVHQSCLENWLKVSKNSKCEICDFKFKFSAVYSQDTPESLPLKLLVQTLVRKFIRATSQTIRLLLVVFVWVIIAPLGTLGIYNAFFKSLSDSFLSLIGFWKILSGLSQDNFMEIGLQVGKIVLKGQIVTLGIVFVITLGLALQELVHSTTPEEELREFHAQRERERVNRRLKEISEKTKEELVQEISEILDRNQNDESFRKKLEDFNFAQELERDQQVNKDDITGLNTDLMQKSSSKVQQRPSRLPVPSPGSSKGFKNFNVVKEDSGSLMKKMTDTSVEKESHPFLLESNDLRGKKKMEIFQESRSTDIFCDICSRKVDSKSSLCKECEDALYKGDSWDDFLKDSLHDSTDFSDNQDQSVSNYFSVGSDNIMMGADSSPNLMWYYVDNFDGNMKSRIGQKGPFNWMRMETLLKNEIITPSTLVRRADQEQFSRLDDLMKNQKPFTPYVFFDYNSNALLDDDLSKLAENVENISGLPSRVSDKANARQAERFVPLAEQPVLQAQEQGAVANNDPEQQQAFLNINIGPDLRVEIEAQGEWNGVLELIGLVGPLKNLFNSMLLYFGIIIFGLSIGVALPRSLGHFTLILMEKFFVPFFVSLSSQLSYLLQVVTDPIIEPIADFIILCGQILTSFIVGGLRNVDSYLSNPNDGYQDVIVDSLRSGITYMGQVFTRENSTIIVQAIARNATIEEADSSSENMHLVFLGTIFIGYLEMLAYKLQREWSSNGLTHPYIKTIMRLFSSVGSGTLLGLKFSFFMVLELVCVPIYCGIFVDYFLLHLFNVPISFPPRIDLLDRHRYVWLFLHWVLGTIFMFQFATYISVIRGTLRRGVFWFIRDPEDPRFQPLNEILERPFFVHLKKLAFGVFVYTIIMGISVGAYVGLFLGFQRLFAQKEGPFKLLPLRWDVTDALLEFPIDLVMIHLFGPWILKATRPQKLFRSAVRSWFQWSAKKLSLTSFLFGGRHSDEEHDLPIESVLSSNGLPQPSNYRFLRVPNHDHIEVTPGVRDVMIPCRENDPLFGRPHESDEEVRANWTKVYIPRYFKPRLRLLLLWHQITALFIFGTATILPCMLVNFLKLVLLGRFVTVQGELYLEQNFSVTIPKELQSEKMLPSGRIDLVCHDIYSWIIGMIIVIAAILPFCLLYKSIYVRYFRLERKNAVRRSNSQRGDDLRGYVGILGPEEESQDLTLSLIERIRLGIITWWLVRGKRYFNMALCGITLLFWVGLVIPILFGLVLELYVLHPLGTPTQSHPMYFILNEWGFGMLSGKIFVSAILAGPDTPMKREMNQIINRGLNFDILKFHRNVIIPVISLLSINILIPKSFINVLNDLETVEEKENLTLYLQYFLFFSVFGMVFFRAAYQGISKFVESVRDEQFKVGRVLHNYDEVAEPISSPINDASDT